VSFVHDTYRFTQVDCVECGLRVVGLYRDEYERMTAGVPPKNQHVEIDWKEKGGKTTRRLVMLHGDAFNCPSCNRRNLIQPANGQAEWN
jgi:hypothetical protein